MLANRVTLIYVLLMTAVVVASNVLVQYPLSGELFGIALGDLLTYGAFTYPVAFLITDLTNRQFGPRVARRVVAAGFLVAVLFSIGASTPRIAIASGSGPGPPHSSTCMPSRHVPVFTHSPSTPVRMVRSGLSTA